MRKLLVFTIPFVLGTALCQYLLPAVWQGWLAGVVLLLGWGISCLSQKQCVRIRFLSIAFSIGILWYSGYSAVFLNPAEELVGTEDTVTIQLLDYPEQKDYGYRCTVKVLKDGIRGKAVYYGDESLALVHPGTLLTVPVKYYSAVSVGGQHSTYYTSRGIFLRMYGQSDPISVNTEDTEKLRWVPAKLSLRLRQSISQVFDQPAAGFITALLTGDREILDEQTMTDLEESGLMHVTAVSGLHCGFLVSLLGVMLGRRQRLTALIGYPILIGYMLMVGATPSVVRACIMAGLLLFAPLLGREGDTPTSLAAAALIILLLNPFAVASVSFQMSFGAVAGLLVVTPKVYSALGGGRRRRSRVTGTLWNFAAGTVSASLGSVLFVMPLSALYFGYFSLVSPLTNLLVLWVTPVMFALAFLGSVLCVLCPGLTFVASVAQFLARYVLAVAGVMAKVPGHGVYFFGDVILIWMVLLYGMLGVCALYRCGRRTWILAVALAMVTLTAAQHYPSYVVKDDTLTVIGVDVGQGAATLLHSGDMTALVDCGTHYSLRGAGGVVADTMAAYGWKGLDYVVLTHYHTDHAGGLEGLLARVEVEELILPQMKESEEQSALQTAVLDVAAQYGVPIRYVEEPLTISLGESRLHSYPPLTKGDTNEEGLTVLCSAGEFDVLITGDMSGSTEKRLIERYDLPDVEVLMVGHHGSKYSSTEELLKAVTPEVGIISVGENSYGHPTYEAMERMAFYDMTLYRTDLQGNVLIRVHH